LAHQALYAAQAFIQVRGTKPVKGLKTAKIFTLAAAGENV